MRHLFLVIALVFAALSMTAQRHTMSATMYYPGTAVGSHTASGDRVDTKKVNNYEVRWVALSPDMFKKGFHMGDTIIVTSERLPNLHGTLWVVKDKMSPRLHNCIDFLVPRKNNYGIPGRCKVEIEKYVPKPHHGNYTVIISLDGFRWDYTDAYDMPFMQYLAVNGVKAVITPSFPSKTFPNHYTLATGLVPDHHGIIANKFEVRATGKIFSLSNDETRSDPQYFGGDPIWLTAKHQGVKSATVYWVGSDVAVENDHANYWWNYQDDQIGRAHV